MTIERKSEPRRGHDGFDGLTLDYLSPHSTPLAVYRGDRDNRDKNDVTFLLVHDGGYGSDAFLAWHLLAPLLREHGNVVAFDLFGFGSSAFLTEFGEAAREHLHVVAVQRLVQQEASRGRKVVLVGSSFGGDIVIASVAAINSDDDSRSVVAAMSICGSYGLGHSSTNFARVRDNDRSFQASEALARFILSPGTEPDKRDVARRHRNTLLPGHWEALTAARVRAPGAGDYARHMPVETLTDNRIPLLLVEGSDDPLLESGWSERRAEEWANTASVVLSDAGHCPNIDHPKRVLGLLQDHLLQRG